MPARLSRRALVAMLLALAPVRPAGACALPPEPRSGASDALAGRSWTIAALNGRPLPAAGCLRFVAGGILQRTSSCAAFRADDRLDGRRLAADALAVARRPCPGADPQEAEAEAMLPAALAGVFATGPGGASGPAGVDPGATDTAAIRLSGARGVSILLRRHLRGQARAACRTAPGPLPRGPARLARTRPDAR